MLDESVSTMNFWRGTCAGPKVKIQQDFHKLVMDSIYKTSSADRLWRINLAERIFDFSKILLDKRGIYYGMRRETRTVNERLCFSNNGLSNSIVFHHHPHESVSQNFEDLDWAV